MKVALKRIALYYIKSISTLHANHMACGFTRYPYCVNHREAQFMHPIGAAN